MITYALPVAFPSTRKHWEIMEKIQRFAARLCTNDFQDSYVNILRKLQWKSLSRLCIERQLLLQFKYIEQLRYLPSYVIKLVPPPVRALRNQHRNVEREISCNFDLFCPAGFIPPRRVTLGNIPLRYGVLAWNMLPPNSAYLHAEDLSSFKREITDFQTFFTLEQRQRTSGTKHPALQQFYLNL
ncbi:MAG: hypothetical protein GY696_34710 [Gammaproteobacteria bacterium]|nr:hypothetical protein [Gammaproteobacteria bacterium]